MNYLETRRWLSNRPASDLENGVAMCQLAFGTLGQSPASCTNGSLCWKQMVRIELNALQFIMQTSGYTVGGLHRRLIDFREQIVFERR